MERSYLLASALPVISFVLSVTFFCLWVGQKNRRHVLNWSLSYACGFLGSGASLARIFLEESAWFSFFGNALLLGMAYFAARGVILRHRGRPCDHILLPIYAATVAAGLWFGFGEPNITARGTASSLGAAAMFAAAIRVTLTSNRTDMIDMLTAAAFALTVAMLIGRPLAIHAFDQPVQTEAEVTGSWWGISFRILAVLSWLSIAVLFTQRIASDLLKELKDQSHTDSLTGVANRRGFFARAGSLGKDRTIAAILCDIDDFKTVNDSYGHKAGDTVIKNFADVLRQAAAPAGCIVGRLGGDEFVGILPDADVVEARAFAETIRAAFTSTTHEGIPASHRITMSVGVVVACSGDALDTVLNQADAALYRAKLKGKNCVEATVIPLPECLGQASGIRHRRGAL